MALSIRETGVLIRSSRFGEAIFGGLGALALRAEEHGSEGSHRKHHTPDGDRPEHEHILTDVPMPIDGKHPRRPQREGEEDCDEDGDDNPIVLGHFSP